MGDAGEMLDARRRASTISPKPTMKVARSMELRPNIAFADRICKE
jgi:hypothetical protein